MSDEDCRIFNLLNYAVTDGNAFLPDEKVADELIQVCFELCNRDNVCTTLRNAKGMLCSTYPGKMIIPIKQRSEDTADGLLEQTSVVSPEFHDLVIKGRFARTRGRFPVPVLLIGGKFVCRSSTLARSPEIYTRTGYQYLMQGEATSQVENDRTKVKKDEATDSKSVHDDINGAHEPKNGMLPSMKQLSNGNGLVAKHKLMQSSIQPVNGTGQNTEWLLDKMRNTDIDILNELRVNVICDLMVENKKVKYGLNVTSSEKVDRQNRYRGFHLLSIPYPGCEFFADYSQNNYRGVGLKFDWKQNFVDAELQIPENIAKLHEAQWKDYMEWDLITLTQNYLKLILQCLVCPSSTGILLHCISGWDRTPLFISLLRLSLWADGLIHQSLNAEEIVYLTLAYDWLLFSHQFSDRIYKNEEIMHFCFEFLKDMTSRDYSLLPVTEKKSNPFASSDSDELFTMDNISCETELPATLTASSSDFNESTDKETSFEEIHKHQDCIQANGQDAHHIQNTDQSLLNLHDVETCLNCIVSNVSCNSNDESHHQSEPTEHNGVISSKMTCNSRNDCFTSSAAVLPLHASETESSSQNDTASTVTHDSIEKGAFLDLAMSPPRSALSSSYETAKHEIFSAFEDGSKSESCRTVMSSSLEIAEEAMKKYCQSEPIPVPLKGKKGSFINNTFLYDGSSVGTGSSVSNAAFTAEAGSSWQMISSPHDLIVDNSSAPSSGHLSHNNSFSCLPNGLHSDSAELKMKLEKRREKLKMAYNVMIPAYSAVVRKQKQLKEQSPFSAFVGTIANFVKRA